MACVVGGPNNVGWACPAGGLPRWRKTVVTPGFRITDVPGKSVQNVWVIRLPPGAQRWYVCIQMLLLLHGSVSSAGVTGGASLTPPGMGW